MAARPGGALAFPSSPTSLLLSRSRSSPDLAAAPTRTGRRRRWLVAGVPAVAGALAASAPASAAVLRDGGATLLVTAGAYSLVRAFDALTERRLIEQNLSRKIVHVLSGVLFMSSWPLFSNSTEARFFAAVVPFLNCARLLTYGLGFFSDEALVKSVTREGKREELLRGPLYYVIVLLIIVLVFWRDSPIGIVSLSMMSGGDGFADIVGRRFGSLKLPFNKKKSWAGSVAMFISGSLLSALMLFYFSWLGHIQVSWDQALGKLLLVALAATVVECIPVTDVVDDNISVPLATINSTEAVVPFLNCTRLLAHGLGIYSDEVLSMVAAKVLLRGPLYSVIVLLIIVLVFLRDSPIGIVSLSMMSSRDGFPDIVGRRFGSLKLPFNKRARMMSYFS